MPKFKRRFGLGVAAAGAFLAVATAATNAAPSAAPAIGAMGDPIKGAEVYKWRCGGCHSLKMNRVGPRHEGVYGRKPGGIPDYRYSDALKAADFVWNDQTLNQWLQNPMALVPGTKMGFRLTAASERADVIAYLREAASAPQEVP